MDMKEEFDFANHKPSTDGKHYFSAEEIGEGKKFVDKLTPRDDLPLIEDEFAKVIPWVDPQWNRLGNVAVTTAGTKGVLCEHIPKDELPQLADGTPADLAPPRGYYRDKDGNFRDVRDLELREVVLRGDFVDGVPVKIIKGMDADYDGMTIPLEKPTRAKKSLQKYRNVMSGLIARTAKK